MEIGEKYFQELLFETEAIEAVSTLDQFWCTHLDPSDHICAPSRMSDRRLHHVLAEYLRRHQDELLRRERGLK
jgi:hypothetical protein